MENSKDGPDHKDKYVHTSRKIFSQEKTICNMEALIFFNFLLQMFSRKYDENNTLILASVCPKLSGGGWKELPINVCDNADGIYAEIMLACMMQTTLIPKKISLQNLDKRMYN